MPRRVKLLNIYIHKKKEEKKRILLIFIDIDLQIN